MSQKSTGSQKKDDKGQLAEAFTTPASRKALTPQEFEAVMARVEPKEQDPHALQGSRDSMLEVAIGREVRAFRNKLGITASDLAKAAGLSLGMLSKIENGVTSASLTTLQRLSKALGVPVTALFRRFEERRDAVFVSAGQGLLIERRGTRAGHQYQLLGHTGGLGGGVVVEPYLITLTEESTFSRCSSMRVSSSSMCWKAKWSIGTPISSIR